jgi:hypothetical protein
MNLDHLPFTAFALEAAATGGASGGEGKTLTLPRPLPAIVRAMAGYEIMSGTAQVGAPAPADDGWRAAVIAADASALTITF